MLEIDIAIAIETASGSPSGIATIRMTTDVMQIWPIFNRVSFSKIACSVIRHFIRRKATYDKKIGNTIPEIFNVELVDQMPTVQKLSEYKFEPKDEATKTGDKLKVPYSGPKIRALKRRDSRMKVIKDDGGSDS